ncbi:uncharacterized protein MONBRDRAFT_39237 [Monosiga brevicollis MX1]|uniref:Uncharacterized protein n=1 Tax=Monosiga brevicollis TaxID=81824 RepID=A9VD30_MONBE|nr:uncharacterized protein MONBRDRAFT_39237 [Monosiga brevicollis MX1]EDQ84608.1 predicted protein [Monosiga brevicollis MX1]|eukprot:XP_001750635.1 hypothetical protein [Monosiga brevicollis MX1]
MAMAQAEVVAGGASSLLCDLWAQLTANERVPLVAPLMARFDAWLDAEVGAQHDPPTAASWPLMPLLNVLAARVVGLLTTGQAPELHTTQAELSALQTSEASHLDATAQQQLRDLGALPATAAAMQDAARICLGISSWPLLRMLLGLRTTQGSLPLLPPPLSVCLATFNALHKPDSAARLSQGARALSKHCHRDTSSQFWGVARGPEPAQNEHALEVLARLVTNVAWINVHELPHATQVVEIRNAEGYGMRWSADGRDFRGFLEPQMVDGHEQGWRH